MKKFSILGSGSFGDVYLGEYLGAPVLSSSLSLFLIFFIFLSIHNMEDRRMFSLRIILDIIDQVAIKELKNILHEMSSIEDEVHNFSFGTQTFHHTFMSDFHYAATQAP